MPGKGKILIVEDDFNCCQMIRTSLEFSGYCVTAAVSTGAEALEKIREQAPDIVLMDIVLEGDMDGIETASRINKLYSMPVIYLTGYSEDTIIERAKITEPFGYVLKPPRTRELISVIEMALYKAKMEKELKKHRHHLEELVEIRTAELTIVNEKLKREAEERTRTMDRLNISLKEKELLIKEVYHRVKNNLQMVSSLLRLQGKATAIVEVKEILDDCQKRIHSISLLHEKLYQTMDFTHIDFDHYITELVNEVVSSSKINGTRIDIDVKVQEIPLKPQIILPCGLIITELVSNAMKHAFKDRKKGKLSLTFQRISEDEVELNVSNTGIPLPTGFSIHNSEKLGLQLVETLVEDQLEGRIEINCNGKTEFKITFNPGV